MEKLGIVTITYNSEKVLDDFIESVLRQSYTNFKLFIIDNYSSDSTISILNNTQDERIRVIKNKENIGVAAANNQGIKEAINSECKQVLLLNNDVVFEKDLLKKLIKFQKRTKASLVAPKIMFYENPNLIWFAGSWFNKSKGFIAEHRGMDEHDNGQYDKEIEIEYAPTCCLLINKVVFEDVGLMDEKYFVYFDDTDFAYRILKHGKHKMYYFPGVRFYHKVGSLTNSRKLEKTRLIRTSFFLKQNVRNQIYFLKKSRSLYSILFIAFLFFRNNIRFIVSKRIKKDFKTFVLINRSYFEGIFM